MLANLQQQIIYIHTYSFSGELTEFETDNHATHHICNLLNLLTAMRSVPKIGIKGVSYSTMASWTRTIRFVLKDNKGIKHTTQIDNMMYLPESTKNLIPVSKRSDDKCNDCGVLTHRRLSIFIWNKDNNAKHIPHPPDYKIPLMPVNEGDAAYVLLMKRIKSITLIFNSSCQLKYAHQ